MSENIFVENREYMEIGNNLYININEKIGTSNHLQPGEKDSSGIEFNPYLRATYSIDHNGIFRANRDMVDSHREYYKKDN